MVIFFSFFSIYFLMTIYLFFFFQAEDGIRDIGVTGVQTCALPIFVDERHNGGGWLHDDLCTLLGGKQYQSFMPRGRFIGWDPWNKWVKPSCVLICEDDYSNGHGFPFVYKALGLGKLIGAPVAGTMTADRKSVV